MWWCEPSSKRNWGNLDTVLENINEQKKTDNELTEDQRNLGICFEQHPCKRQETRLKLDGALQIFQPSWVKIETEYDNNDNENDIRKTKSTNLRNKKKNNFNKIEDM